MMKNELEKLIESGKVERAITIAQAILLAFCIGALIYILSSCGKESLPYTPTKVATIRLDTVDCIVYTYYVLGKDTVVVSEEGKRDLCGSRSHGVCGDMFTKLVCPSCLYDTTIVYR